jgi:hypothetical protein
MLDAWERDTGADTPPSRVILYTCLALAFGAMTVVLAAGIWEPDRRRIIYVLAPVATVVAVARLVRAVRALQQERGAPSRP